MKVSSLVTYCIFLSLSNQKLTSQVSDFSLVSSGPHSLTQVSSSWSLWPLLLSLGSLTHVCTLNTVAKDRQKCLRSCSQMCFFLFWTKMCSHCLNSCSMTTNSSNLRSLSSIDQETHKLLHCCLLPASLLSPSWKLLRSDAEPVPTGQLNQSLDKAVQDGLLW